MLSHRETGLYVAVSAAGKRQGMGDIRDADKLGLGAGGDDMYTGVGCDIIGHKKPP